MQALGPGGITRGHREIIDLAPVRLPAVKFVFNPTEAGDHKTPD